MSKGKTYTQRNEWEDKGKLSRREEMVKLNLEGTGVSQAVKGNMHFSQRKQHVQRCESKIELGILGKLSFFND